MNKSEIITEYRAFTEKYGLKPEQAILGAGAACVLLGVRLVTQDLDLYVPADLYEALKDSGQYEVIVQKTRDYTTKSNWLKWSDKIEVAAYSSGQIALVSGVGCFCAEQLYLHKLRTNRPKDQRDIERLERLICVL